jgi:hypothetical protein
MLIVFKLNFIFTQKTDEISMDFVICHDESEGRNRLQLKL